MVVGLLAAFFFDSRAFFICITPRHSRSIVASPHVQSYAVKRWLVLDSFLSVVVIVALKRDF